MMQVNETLNEGLKRGYAITVTAAELDAKVEGKLKEAQPSIEMKGFRKGKVPMALLRKQHSQRLIGESMQEAIDGALSEHLETTGDRPAAQPEMKMTNADWKEGDDVEVDVSYEKLPDINAVDFAKIKLERLVVKADEASVKEALDNLAESPQAVTYEVKKTQAKKSRPSCSGFLGQS
jgi:trigger factor